MCWLACSERAPKLLRWKLSSKGKGGLAGHSDIYPLGSYSGVTYREPRSETFTRGGGGVGWGGTHGSSVAAGAGRRGLSRSGAQGRVSSEREAAARPGAVLARRRREAALGRHLVPVATAVTLRVTVTRGFGARPASGTARVRAPRVRIRVFHENDSGGTDRFLLLDVSCPDHAMLWVCRADGEPDLTPRSWTWGLEI